MFFLVYFFNSNLAAGHRGPAICSLSSSFQKRRLQRKSLLVSRHRCRNGSYRYLGAGVSSASNIFLQSYSQLQRLFSQDRIHNDFKIGSFITGLYASLDIQNVVGDDAVNL